MKLSTEEDFTITSTENNTINISTLDTESTSIDSQIHKVKIIDGEAQFNVPNAAESTYTGFKFTKYGEIFVFFYWSGRPFLMIGPDCM